jgi:hypothetical protein
LLYWCASEEDMMKTKTWTNNSNAKRLQLFVVRTGLRAGRAARRGRK